MPIKELKKIKVYKDGDHDWEVSIVEINGDKTVGVRRWKNRGDGYIGPTKMGINVSPKILSKMIGDGIFEKAMKETGYVEEEPKAKKKKKNGKASAKAEA